MWPLRRPHLEFDDGDYEQEDTLPEPPKCRKQERRRVNPLIDAEAGVVCDTSNDEGSDDENDDLGKFIVADDIEF